MESELLQVLLWSPVVPLLAGFFAGILINGRRWFWRGLLAGAVGAVILCFITVQIIYIGGYVVVVTDLYTGTRTELTAYQAFVDGIYNPIFWGAIAGIVGAGIATWLRNRWKKRLPIPPPSPPARPPQPMRANLIEPRACPSCGNVNRLGDKFCRKCGTSLPTVPVEEKAYCTRCATELKKGAEFCHSCGQAVTRKPPAPEEVRLLNKS